MFEGRSAKSITEQDLHDIVARAAREDETIEFKADAYHISDKSPGADKGAKLCIDVSAFANANGGWIICGIGEDRINNPGAAGEVTGVPILSSQDQALLDLNRAVREGVQPYPVGIEFNIIQLGTYTQHPHAVIIHIPASYNRPHQVKFNGKYIFQIRRSNGNDNMSLDELRTQFTLASSVSEKIRAFRKQRVEAVFNGEEDIPVPLLQASRLIFHVIPITFYEIALDLSIFDSPNKAVWISQTRFYNGYFNADGYVIPTGKYEPGGMRGYTQLFRNGIFEYVEPISSSGEIAKQVSLEGIESHLLQILPRALTLQTNLVGVPVAIMLSLTNISGSIFIKRGGPNEEKNPWGEIPYRKKFFLVPDIIEQDLNKDVKAILRPIFNILWNAGNFPASESYDKDGEWIKRG